MHYLDRWVGRAGVFLAALSAVLLLSATVIITWMVFKRSIGLQNSWELETAIELMIAAIFLGSPYTLATGGHVKMDLLESIVPGRIQRKLSLLAKLAGCAICVYLGWEGLGMAVHAFATGERTLGVWRALVWPKYATIPVGMFLTALQYLVEIRKDHAVNADKNNQRSEA
ncbi:TRAP transporter small permease [Paralcaligenes sp. KSB-10]|uniref:TRAP transporter small permease subunit n=1 Tax=Paralcaligenes sp. KSB-10 TaxID=2901142 RepID=UPI001E6525B1|nr:TRAP transporter small permease [Paralcaligenes sp. KSB-10]UHL64295.1 TRAP transporter small permease [Paralcaligenes sp. KSB-10]